jgi:hypothetical protein
MKRYLVVTLLTMLFMIFTAEIDFNSNNTVPNVNILAVSAIAQTGCVLCKTSTTECQRIIIGNTIIIYMGDSEPCPGGDQK